MGIIAKEEGKQKCSGAVLVRGRVVGMYEGERESERGALFMQSQKYGWPGMFLLARLHRHAHMHMMHDKVYGTSWLITFKTFLFQDKI